MNHVFINVLRYFWYVVKLYYYYLNVLHLKAYSCLVPKICRQNLYTSFGTIVYVVSWVSRRDMTRRPASTDRTARRQFQATGQPVSRTQSSDAMTSRLPRYEAYSVCNADASNAGRSLCVQISREQSYPLPIYWYQSKGNWLRYNFAADSFYIMLIFAFDKLNIRHISASGLVDLLT